LTALLGELPEGVFWNNEECLYQGPENRIYLPTIRDDELKWRRFPRETTVDTARPIFEEKFPREVFVWPDEEIRSLTPDPESTRKEYNQSPVGTIVTEDLGDMTKRFNPFRMFSQMGESPSKTDDPASNLETMKSNQQGSIPVKKEEMATHVWTQMAGTGTSSAAAVPPPVLTGGKIDCPIASNPF
jgi:hypothetical protein